MDEHLTFEFEPTHPMEDAPELLWPGKHPCRAARYSPARLRESYGQARNGWMNKLFQGDNLQVMSHLLGAFRGRIQLVYIDPPFDSRADYKRKIELKKAGQSDSAFFQEKQYGDIWSHDEYLQFMYERLILIRQLMSDTASIYLHCDWHKAAYLRLLMDEVFGPERCLNEIAWCYQGAGRAVTQYKRKHDTLLFYTKTGNWTFHARAVGTPFGDKQKRKFCGRDANGYYKEYRHANGKVYRKYLRDDDFLPCNDWWSDIFVIQAHAERLGYPTQKPEALLSRIIRASSDPGDIVFDCFMGSGTTQAVAMKLGRRFIGADVNPGAVQITTKRLLSAAGQPPAEGEVRYTGFQVYTVGAQNTPRAEADVAREDGRLVIRAFYPLELMGKLSLKKENVGDWRQLADSVMIDWNYDGAVLRPAVTDLPGKREMVRGTYKIPENAGVIRVKITDLLGQSMEVEVPRQKS